MHDFVEKELLLLKKEYEKPQMSQAQFEELRAKMEEAKMADKKDKIKRISLTRYKKSAPKNRCLMMWQRRWRNSVCARRLWGRLLWVMLWV